MEAPVFSAISVKQIYKYLAEGRYAVPKLQRAFVWSGLKAAKLLDSKHLSKSFSVE